MYIWHASVVLDPADYVYLNGSTTYWLAIHYTGTEYGVFGADVYPGRIGDGMYPFYYPGQGWYFMYGDLVFGLSGTVGGSSALERNSWGAIKSRYL